jgi:hypothetical protein
MTVNPEVTGQRLKFGVHRLAFTAWRSPLGVHRSPFPALSAFPAFSLNLELPELNSRVLSPDPALAERMRRLRLRPEEFEELFLRSGGPGGQNVNKVSTAVTLVHQPSGISVTVQDTRSQYRNRELAVHRLVNLIEHRRKQEMAKRQAEFEQRRRQNSRRPKSLRREIRKSKEHRAVIKRTRAKVSPE